jgi:hypothetical protein
MRNELPSRSERPSSERVPEGNFRLIRLLVVCIAAAALLMGSGLVRLRKRLERWVYDRHAED